MQQLMRYPGEGPGCFVLCAPVALAGRGCCQERQHAGTGRDRGAMLRWLQGVPCRRACRALGFQARRRVWVIAMAARANFFSRNRWTCSRTTMYLRVLADFNPGEIIFDIFGECSCLHAPSTTASAISGASLYLACSFCSRGFEQQGNVHAATVIED